MELAVDQRVTGTDSLVRKVVAINGNSVVFRVGLNGDEETLSRSAFIALAAPPPPGQPSPEDYDDVAPGIVVEVEVTDAPAVPQSVTPRQLRLALLGAGKLEEVDAFVASSAVPEAARISWEYAVEYRRDDPTLNTMAGLLNPPLSAVQIDALFVAAAAI